MSVPAWLNYHHLQYFHATAREGSVTAAAKRLRLAQPTLSGQIKQLEEMLGEPLFERRGRRLELTEAGRTVYHYADEIFGLGEELLQAVRGRPAGRPLRFAVGVSDTLPKLIVYRLLSGVLAGPGDTRLEVQDGEAPALLVELGAHRLDLVLSDAPLPSGSGVRAYSHALGESGISFFARGDVAAALRPTFPQSLDGAPVLLPVRGTPMRRALDEWFDRLKLKPRIVAEVGDSALLKTFGQAGAGAFAAPTVVAEEVSQQYRVSQFGATAEVREHFWAISAERKIRHPAVNAVVEGARKLLG